MISVRRARAADAVAMGAVHVAVWRNAYATILSPEFLAHLSVPRCAAHYDASIRTGVGVYVATASGLDNPAGLAPRVIGFASATRPRAMFESDERLAEGEIETLYVLDDWRERGVGRRLMRAAAGHLAEIGCRSAYLWVLRDNPSRWFYERLGGRAVAQGWTMVDYQQVMKMAYVWDPIEQLLQASPQAS
jgi:GNAT superfamily N-acetyltransferase